jgi:hypothetical protein
MNPGLKAWDCSWCRVSHSAEQCFENTRPLEGRVSAGGRMKKKLYFREWVAILIVVGCVVAFGLIAFLNRV